MALKTALYATVVALGFLWIGEGVTDLTAEVRGKIARVEAALNR